MREIKLKTVQVNLKEVTGEDTTIPFSYKDTIKGLLNAFIDKGMTIEDVEKRLKIRGKINSSEDVLTLEDVDYEYLKGLVLEEKWKFADQAIIDFVNEIKNAKQVN